MDGYDAMTDRPPIAWRNTTVEVGGGREYAADLHRPSIQVSVWYMYNKK